MEGVLDLILAILLLTSVFTGYSRGVARELIELVTIVFGVPIAFRVGPRLVSAVSQLPEANGALIGGFAVLLMISVVVTIGSRAAQRAGILAEPTPSDRVAGSVVGLARSLILVWLLATTLAAAPATAFASLAAESRIATAMTGDTAVNAFTSLTGNQDVQALIAFNRQYPGGPLISDDVYEIPAFDRSRLDSEPSTAANMLPLVNGGRAQAGVASALQWSQALANVAEAYAFELYVDGFFAHDSPRTGNVGDRLRTAGVDYRVAGENLALAPTLAIAHEGLMNSPGHRANILGDYTSIGIGAVRGPIGLVIVQVFHR